ncbi:(d)CMP kinase [Thiohalobacter sp. IOR34]|uniref:(d)CMP kinase n=1 Tax=Thiohalobacter sp. IOR34 TaxID=3057176 RepID=UPI0025B18A3D|nr:(d)CMP kinase [Thiohalobacter sp. IOR34]WJW76691.1 (d)CMP kinase [Thiohalobacter sp. IOR34]
MNNETIPVITIDGPSGSGKGTIGRALARELGWHFLDSGALYRVLALAALRRGLALDDESALAELAARLDVRFPAEGDGVILDGEAVDREIRSEKAGDAASRVATLPAVRAALLERQRAFRTAPGLVADGRDMGSVVFPDAPLKIYLTASAEERARRRYQQLREKGIEADMAALVEEIAARDARDMNRPVAPLKPAEDAVIIDTSALDIDATLDQVRQLVAERLGRAG